MSDIQEQFKAALSRWASGVAVVLVDTENGVKGITISAFMSGSLHPPLVSFAVNRTSDFVDTLKQAKEFTLSILSEDQRKDSDYWAGWTKEQKSNLITQRSSVFVEHAVVHITLKHHAQHDCGDHILYIAELVSAESYDKDPLVYHRGSYGL